ncbi:MAG TPA: AMP-binding protein [Pseudonocardia sp.]|nr:AMP-binding protein [Pseudonocardia sp.]
MTGPEDYLARGLWCAASVGWSLPTAAEHWPDRTALAIAASGRPAEHYTFAALHDRVRAAAADLAARGVRPGDRVVAQLPNRIELLVVILAAWQLGAVAVPLLPMYRGRELAHILRVTRPAALVAATARGDRRPAAELDEVLADLGHDPAARYAVGTAHPGWRPLPTAPPPPHNLPASRGFRQGESGILSGPAEQVPHWPAAPDECCLLLFTSGTTSEPKGVRHSSRSLLAEARSYRDEALLGAEQPVLVPAPVPHIGAVVACTLLPCLTAAPTVLLESWDVEVAVRACAEEKVALAIGAPVFLAELLDRYEREPDGGAGHRISMFHTGAAPTGDSVVVRAQRLGVTAWRAWGMTEAPTLTSGHPGDPLDRRTRTDGRVDVGSEVQAVDEHRAPLPAGTPGELRIRSPKLMLGYLDPAHQAAAVDAEGWFYTGDIGVVDADGWVTIQGRLKDIINRGGEKFSAAEIESLVGEHPDIEAVAVVGLPDQRLGEQVGAFVTLRAGRSWPGEAVLLAHLERHQLARQKYPVIWRVLDQLPRTPTGKIQKRQLLADWHPDRDHV